jgi:flagellar biosynthesis protein FlhB
MAKNDSGTKTEKPTPKRRQDARKEGQIARSVDLVQWVALLIATFVLPRTVGAAMDRLADASRQLLATAARGEAGPAFGALGELLVSLAAALAPLFVLMLVVVLLGLASQGGVVIATKALAPKWERISPKKGLKRIFSAQSLMETAKALTRLVIFGVVVWVVVRSSVLELLTGTPKSLDIVAPALGRTVLLTLRLSAAAGIVVGVADMVFQRWQQEKKLRMSRQDIRQEMKNSEGDPMVRSRRRAAHAKLSRNALLAGVDDATVVVVNPTHVAVALRYRDGDGAPVVVAKGGDEVARRIRERALEQRVPVLEARPLARVLFDTVDIGEHIPGELFEAVAVVLAFVFRDRRRAWSGGVHRIEVPVPRALVEAR